MTEYMMIGEVLKPQGVRGEVKILSHASDIESYRDWKVLYLQEGEAWLPVPFSLSRIHEGFVYARLNGCSTMDEAEAYRGKCLFVDRAHAAPLPKGEVYICDLIGCHATDADGNDFGVLKDVLQYGSADIFVFSTSKGTMMAPFLKAVFPETDPENRRILVIPERLEEVAVFED